MLLALIRKELIVLSRDVQGLAALFVLPAIFIIIMSMALKDVYSPHVDHLAWSVVNQDNGELSKTLLARWEKENGKPVALPSDWQHALSEGQLKYVIRIEKGADRDLAQAGKPDRQRIALLTDPGMDFGVFASLRARIIAAATALRVETMIRQVPGFESIGDMDSAALDGAGIVDAERIHSGRRLTSVQHNVPAWLVFGMFFVVTTIAGLFVEERGSGTLSRLGSLGASPLMMLLAKVLPFMLINCLQAVLMLGLGMYVIPLLGGDALSLAGVDWPALAAMLLAISLAAISLALLVATLVRSHAQASAIGPAMNILMAAIGGIMVPTMVMPGAMQKLAQFSPMNWALEGLLNVLIRGGGLSSIRIEAAQLLGLAIACISLAYLVFRFRKA